MVFQAPTLMPWASALNNVALPLELQGVAKAEAEVQARAALAGVRLTGSEAAKPAQLSGGMAMRASLARALVTRPRLLLLDEPFAALDALTREAMQQELLRIAARAGKTVFFITHQIDEAVLLGDRVAVLSARPGRLLEIVKIELPRPRSLEMKRSRELQSYVDHIWRLVSETEAGAGKEGP